MIASKSIGFTLIFTLITVVQSGSVDVKSQCPKGTVCSLYSDCHSTDSDEDLEDFCTLDGRLGLCCPVKDDCVYPGSKSVFVPSYQAASSHLSKPLISNEVLTSVVEEAQLNSDQIVALISKISAEHESKRVKRQAENGEEKSREEIYQRNLGIVPNLSDAGSSKEALLNQQLTLSLSKKLGLKTPKQVETLKSIQIIESDKCSNNNITCDQYAKYRPIDGSCNNLDNPYWGKVLTPYARVLLPQYDDSVDAPKLSGPSGNTLPLARYVSNTLFKDRPMAHHNLDTLALAYGQFLDHDLTQVVGSTLPEGGAITCCDSSNNVLDAKSLHPACFPIIIPETDPFYSQYNVTCLTFARTAFGLPENCVLGPRTQINNLTPWVDASIVYGSDLVTSKKLRAFTGGQLAHQTVSSGQILPPQNDTCNNGTACLEGADSRVNQQPGLMATHITWLREHNRIAKELEKLNPAWSDEEIFQEARRIVIAEFQQVTYNEFLPLIIGSDLMKKYDLYSLESGFNEFYDPNLSPAIIQEFATAAFRLHTLIPGFIELRDSSLKVTRNTSLTKLYYNPSVFYEKPSVFQSIINGLLSQPVCPADNIITEAITNHLFPPGTHGSDEPWGFDLVSIDIQRGRDHGLAGYNEWREACGFKTAKNFSDLSEFFYPESLPLVEKLYSSVDDIDLVVGLNLEPRPEGQNVGPTAACIITETFRRLKFSDRFWFENAGQPSSFDISQLNSIRNVTYARIHCDNNEIEFVQENAFLQPSDSNPRISCSQLSSKSVDLSLWKREALGTYGASLI